MMQNKLEITPDFESGFLPNGWYFSLEIPDEETNTEYINSIKDKVEGKEFGLYMPAPKESSAGSYNLVLMPIYSWGDVIVGKGGWDRESSSSIYNELKLGDIYIVSRYAKNGSKQLKNGYLADTSGTNGTVVTTYVRNKFGDIPWEPDTVEYNGVPCNVIREDVYNFFNELAHRLDGKIIKYTGEDGVSAFTESDIVPKNNKFVVEDFLRLLPEDAYIVGGGAEQTTTNLSQSLKLKNGHFYRAHVSNYNSPKIFELSSFHEGYWMSQFGLYIYYEEVEEPKLRDIYTNKYEVALAIADKVGSTNDHLTNIFEALVEIAMLKGLSGAYTTKYEILKALALNEGAIGTLSNSYECLLGLAGIYGETNFSNNYEAALYLLENAEAGFGGMSFTAVTAGAIGMSHHGTNATTTIPRLQYSRDGENWTDWMFETLFANAGDKIYFKGINDKISYSNENYSNFSLTGSFKANGNIMSLLYGDDYKEKVSLANKDYCFYGLFYGTKGILTSPKLPAATLSNYCYAYMFDGTNIEKMPELPAKTLIYRCYYSMFANCKSLTETTLLPAERLIGDCYRGMFNGATSLHIVRANFITTPSDDYTKDWLNDVAAEGTFYVSKDAVWIDEITRGADTIPVNWEIKGRTPIPYVYVTIDSVQVRLRSDRTFNEQGYTELYTQDVYESEEEVEEIDVDTTYPNEGDNFYTSYIIESGPVLTYIGNEYHSSAGIVASESWAHYTAELEEGKTYTYVFGGNTTSYYRYIGKRPGDSVSIISSTNSDYRKRETLTYTWTANETTIYHFYTRTATAGSPNPPLLYLADSASTVLNLDED